MSVLIVVFYGHFATEVAKILAKEHAFCNFCNPKIRSVTAQSGHWSHFFSIAPAPITFTIHPARSIHYIYDPAIAEYIV